MSWNFSLAVSGIARDGGDAYLSCASANYTYNVYSMFVKAFGVPGIRQFHDMPCDQALPRLEEGIAAMRADPEEYKLMNPKNGWGDYEGALGLLEELAQWCRDYPGAKLRVS